MNPQSEMVGADSCRRWNSRRCLMANGNAQRCASAGRQQELAPTGGDSFIMIVHDLTGRKRWEMEIKKLNEDMERRVVERIAQLDDTVKKPEAEICAQKEIKEKLRQQVEYLERFKNATIQIKGHSYDVYGKL